MTKSQLLSRVSVQCNACRERHIVIAFLFASLYNAGIVFKRMDMIVKLLLGLLSGRGIILVFRAPRRYKIPRETPQ